MTGSTFFLENKKLIAEDKTACWQALAAGSGAASAADSPTLIPILRCALEKIRTEFTKK